MSNFFKTFVKGILYLITLPVLIIGLAVYFVISLFSFFVIGTKAIITYFKGENPFGDLPEDIEAKRRLAIAAGINEEPSENNQETSNSYIFTTSPNQTIYNTNDIPSPQGTSSNNEGTNLSQEENTVVSSSVEDMFDDNIVSQETPQEEIIPHEKVIHDEYYIEEDDETSGVDIFSDGGDDND